MIDKLKIGDILLLTQWDGEHRDPPAWAIVTETGRRYGTDVHMLACADGGFMKLWCDQRWTLEANHDVWAVMPHDKVPDHVWATLMELRLTGVLEV